MFRPSVLPMIVAMLLLSLLVVGAPAQQTPAQAESVQVDRVTPLVQEVNKTVDQLSDSATRAVLNDPAKRAQMAAKALPILRKLKSLADQLQATGEERGKDNAKTMRGEILPLLVIYGDDTTRAELQKTAAGSEKQQALTARAMLINADWVRANADAASQTALLAQAAALVKQDPKSEDLAEQLVQMYSRGASSPQMAEQAKQLISQTDTEVGQVVRKQLAMEAQLRTLEGKPIAIAGVLNDGHPFDIAQWKGKVILVDFWATWCGPCRASLPRVKQTYTQYHAKGLEVLGVSCDNEPEALSKFLHDNPDMPWPQLFDAKNPGWSPIAKSFGIESIPTMFVIDRKGILRSAVAHDNFEELIPKLLNE